MDDRHTLHDARTGRFVSKENAALNPDTTVAVTPKARTVTAEQYQRLQDHLTAITDGMATAGEAARDAADDILAILDLVKEKP